MPMSKFSKKFIGKGMQNCIPFLLFLVVVTITSLARARPAKAASDFKAFSWETKEELVQHLKNDRDSNGIKYNDYDFKVNTGAKDYYLRVAGDSKPINLLQRCDGKVHEDPNEENKPPYRYWFWVKGNKLRSSGIHWSTDSFVATTKPLTYKNGNYNTNQYENRVKISRLEATGGKFIESKGKPVTVNGASYGITLYVIDLKPWYDKSYSKLADDYSGHVYLQTIPSIYSVNERRLAGPFTTLNQWKSAARARNFAESGIRTYKDHYNQIIPINKTIRHTLRIYRMHTSKGNPVAGKITDNGKVDESCMFGRNNSFIGKKSLKAGSVFKFSNDISTYKYDGTTYYLKGIREVHVDENGNVQPYAKFMMLDKLTDNPVAGTDKTTDKYTKVHSTDVSKVDSISSKELMYYKEYSIKVKENSFESKTESNNNNTKSVVAGKKTGLTGRKKWKQIANYMQGLYWKNGIKENRIYLVYQEVPETNIKVYNKVYEHVDGSGYVCVSGGTSPVYKEKIQSGDDSISVNLTKIQQRSIAAEKPDSGGCAAVYKTLGGKKYFPKSIKISYTDPDGDDQKKTFNVKDYYYDSANESVHEAGDNFVETETRKTYSVSNGHKDTEKALKAIVNYVYEKVKLQAGRSGEVKIEINYYQPKVPNVALIYRRSYDDDGKAVDTLVQTKTLDDTVINSTTDEKNCEGSYGPYPTELAFIKNSQGKWSIAQNQSTTGKDDTNTLPLVEEVVYKSDVKDYHDAGSSSWNGNGLREETKYYVEKNGTSHSVSYSTVFRGNAVKLVYGEKQASYTFNIFYAKRHNGALEPWKLGKTITRYVDTTPEEESKRTHYLTYNDTLAGMGVTSVLKPENYKLHDELTSTEGNSDLVRVLGQRTILVWPQKSKDSVTVNVFYISDEVLPPTTRPSFPVTQGSSSETTTWDDLRTTMGGESNPVEASSLEHCSSEGLIEKDEVSTVSSTEQSAELEGAADLTLPNGKKDWKNGGKYSPNKLKSRAVTTSYLSKGAVKKHNVQTKFTVRTYRDIFTYHPRWGTDENGNSVNLSYTTYEGMQYGSFEVDVKTVYFELLRAEVWQPEMAKVFNYAFPNSVAGSASGLDGDGDCRTLPKILFQLKDYYVLLNNNFSDWGSNNWGESTFGEAWCKINTAALTDIILKAPDVTLQEGQERPSYTDMISTVHAKLPSIIKSNWDVQSDILSFFHPSWEDQVAGQFDYILDRSTYGIKVTTFAASPAPGSVGDYDSLNKDDSVNAFRIPRANMSNDDHFTLKGIEIEQSKLNSKSELDGPDPSSRVSIKYKQFGTSVGDSQKEGWVYAWDVNRVILHTPLAITTYISKYERGRCQSIIEHGDREPITLGTPFKIGLDYHGDFSSVGYGDNIDTHEFVLEDDTAYFTFPFPVYTTYKDGAAVFREANKIFRVSGVSKTVFYPAYWAKEKTHLIRTEIEALNVVGQDAMAGILPRRDRVCVLSNECRDYYRPYFEKAIDLTGILTNLRITDVADYPVLQNVFRKDGTNGTSKYDRTGFSISGGTTNFLGDATGGTATFPVVNGDTLGSVKYGVFKTGYKVRYNLTTISGLTGLGDYIKIVPTYTWVPKSTLTDSNPVSIPVRVYYDEKVNGTDQKLVEVGGLMDQNNLHPLCIGDKENNCQLQDLQDSADLMGMSYQDLIRKVSNAWSYNSVAISSNMKVSEGGKNKSILSKASDGKMLPLEGCVDRKTLNNSLQNFSTPVLNHNGLSHS